MEVRAAEEGSAVVRSKRAYCAHDEGDCRQSDVFWSVFRLRAHMRSLYGPDMPENSCCTL